MLSPEFKLDSETGVYTFRLLKPYDQISSALSGITVGLDKTSEELILKTVFLVDALNHYFPPIVAVDLSRLPKVRVQICSDGDKCLSDLDEATKQGIVKRPEGKIVFLYFNITSETGTWTLVDIPGYQPRDFI